MLSGSLNDSHVQWNDEAVLVRATPLTYFAFLNLILQARTSSAKSYFLLLFHMVTNYRNENQGSVRI